jgi:hypothetical protein
MTLHQPITLEIIAEKINGLTTCFNNQEERIKHLEDQRADIAADLSVIKAKLNLIGAIGLILMGSIVVLLFSLLTHASPALLP